MSKNNEVVLAENENMVMAKPNAPAKLSVFSDEKSFELAIRMATSLAKSTVVPKDYQGNEGNCLIAIEMASRINTSPMMVMQNLYIVNGRPAWSSQWIIAMINSSRRYKTELQFEFGNDKDDGGLSCQAWAEDYNGHKVLGPKVTMKMANEEGWTNKNGSKWKTMPQVMIQYRAASFFGRMNCPDMIMGIYSQDEAIEMVDLGDSSFGIMVDPDTGEAKEYDLIEDSAITQEQRQALFATMKEKFGDDGNAVLKAMISQEGLDSTEKMKLSVYNRILENVEKIVNGENPYPVAKDGNATPKS